MSSIRDIKGGDSFEQKNKKLLEEIHQQNFLIDQMKSIVKNAHRYEQFYQHQKTKKYRNCGI